MWQVTNETPFAVDQDWVRDRTGREIWLVVVKATFDIHPDGGIAVSAAQPPVVRAPQYHGKAGASSLKYDSDMVPAKTTTDILVTGHAYAPYQEPVTRMDAGFVVGGVRKVMRIIGDRRWGAVGPSSPEPFTMMPLLYERAFGGIDLRSPEPDRDWDARNPVGRGFAISRHNARDLLLPNIESPDQPITSWRDRPDPVGCGPLACHWQPRASLAGTYDESWEKNRKPLSPEDLSDLYYQCAPTDQRPPGFLRGGEPVELHHLTRQGELRFALPKIHLGFETRFYGGGSAVHTCRQLHSVILEPDELRLSLVWHSSLPCHSRVHKLLDTLVTVKTIMRNSERPFVKQSLEVIE